MKTHHIYGYILALLIFFTPLLLISEDINGPWTEIADLMKLRNYDGVIDKLNENAKKTNQLERKGWLYYQIGSVYLEYKHDYDSALKVFSEVLLLKKQIGSISPDFSDCIALTQMSIADIYRRTDKYDKAIKEYEKVINEHPKTRYAKIASEDIKGINNALSEIEFYNKVINDLPNTDISAEIQFEIAELYLSPQNLNNPEKAITEFHKVIENYPNSPKSIEAQFKIANIYRSTLRDPYKAISEYQKVLEKGFFAGNLSAESMFQIGIIFYSDLHEYSKALDIFTKFLNDYPTYWKFPAGVYWQAICYEQMGLYSEATKSYELFLQIYPDNESSLSADIGRLGERDVKTRIRAKIAELIKNAPKIQWDLAEQLNSAGKYREALIAYRKLISEYPNTSYAKDAKLQMERIENLADIQILQDIVKKGTNDAPYAQYRIAEIYELEMQDYSRAIKEYQLIVKEYPETYWSAESLLKIGLIYSGSGNSRLIKIEREQKKLSINTNFKKAIESYQKLIDEHPKSYRSAEAHYNLGEIYRIHIGDYNKALYEYGKVISDYPNKSFYEREGFSDSLAERAKFKIGKVYRENLKDNDHALKIFNEFLSDYPNSCRKSAIYSYIAIIQEEKKDYRSEITSLEKIIEFVIDSNVQSLYFMREAVLELKPSDSAINVSDIQSEIAKRIKQKILQIQSLNIPK